MLTQTFSKNNYEGDSTAVISFFIKTYKEENILYFYTKKMSVSQADNLLESISADRKIAGETIDNLFNSIEWRVLKNPGFDNPKIQIFWSDELTNFLKKFDLIEIKNGETYMVSQSSETKVKKSK